MIKKKQKIISAVIFLCIIFLMPIIFIFSGKKDVLESENRKPAKKPDLTFASVMDKSYMSKIDGYLSDNFPGRVNWVKTKLTIDRMLGKSIINNIYIGDKMLMEKLPEPNYDEVQKSIDAINKFAEHYGNTKVSFMLAPTSAGIYPDKLPASAPQLNQRDFIYESTSRLSANVSFIDIYDTMVNERDKYIYYRTDHHWTSYGAYCAYKHASTNLGYKAVELDKFDVEHASSDFTGTFYNKCFYDGVDKDIIDIYTFPNGNNVTSVTMNDGIKEETSDSIYFREYLEGGDKYCVFLGKNKAYMNIKTDALNNKKILVIKDSYANSFIPFLVNHYSEIAVLDLRYVKTSIKEYVDPDKYDQTLFLYNASTFSQDSNIKMAGFFQ